MGKSETKGNYLKDFCSYLEIFLDFLVLFLDTELT